MLLDSRMNFTQQNFLICLDKTKLLCQVRKVWFQFMHLISNKIKRSWLGFDMKILIGIWSLFFYTSIIRIVAIQIDFKVQSTSMSSKIQFWLSILILKV